MLGAGLFAANLSTTFRLRKFGMADGATYPLMFQVTRPASGSPSYLRFFELIEPQAKHLKATCMGIRRYALNGSVSSEVPWWPSADCLPAWKQCSGHQALYRS